MPARESQRRCGRRTRTGHGSASRPRAPPAPGRKTPPEQSCALPDPAHGRAARDLHEAPAEPELRSAGIAARSPGGMARCIRFRIWRGSRGMREGGSFSCRTSARATAVFQSTARRYIQCAGCSSGAATWSGTDGSGPAAASRLHSRCVQSGVQDSIPSSSKHALAGRHRRPRGSERPPSIRRGAKGSGSFEPLTRRMILRAGSMIRHVRLSRSRMCRCSRYLT